VLVLTRRSRPRFSAARVSGCPRSPVASRRPRPDDVSPRFPARGTGLRAALIAATGKLPDGATELECDRLESPLRQWEALRIRPVGSSAEQMPQDVERELAVAIAERPLLLGRQAEVGAARVLRTFTDATSCKRFASTGFSAAMPPCSASMHRVIPRSRLEPALRRNAAAPCAHARGLITRRSQVQILPPLLTRPLVTGPSCSQVGGVAAERSSARPWNVATPLNCAGVAENGWLPSRITSGRRAREMLRNGRELPGSGAPGHVCGRRFACRSDGRPHCIARHISLGFGPRSAASP
jgi:hypothetical protein